MNQRATLQALDADILSAFAAAGMGDTGTYRSPDGDETSISYLFDDVEGSPTFGQTLPRNAANEADAYKRWAAATWAGTRAQMRRWKREQDQAAIVEPTVPE